jgi:hypothetical protein
MKDILRNKQAGVCASQQLEWGSTAYLGHLATLLDSNMTYLHSTLNWGITITVGGIGLVLARASFPDQMSLLALLALLPVLTHFAVRTAKAYLNVMRWTTLEKHIIEEFLRRDDSGGWDLMRRRILTYHCAWASPLRFWHVVQKVLFELGFAYFFGIVVGLALYTAVRVGASWTALLGWPIAASLVGAEIWMGLWRSPYFRQVAPDELATRQK